MLLFYPPNNNNRMMDDFTDQDWFAESDDIVTKNPTEHSPLHLTVDSGLQNQQYHVDLFELNVPIDENVYYTGEQQNRYTNLPHVLETPQIITETTGLLPIPFELSTVDDTYIQTQEPCGDQRKLIELPTTISQNGCNNHKNFSMDSQPTTSLAILEPCIKQKHAYQQSESDWAIQQQQYCEFNNSITIVNNQFTTVSNDAYPTSIPVQASLSTCSNLVQFNSAAAYHPSSNFYTSEHFSDQVSIPLNALKTTEPIILTEFPNHNFQQSQIQLNANNDVKTVAKKTPKPKKKTSINKNIAEKEKVRQETEQLGTSESSELEKRLAKRLFTNQKTATLEFNDPQHAIEFALLMSQCQQLTQQKANGMNVNLELKVLEARIAEYIENATSATQNSIVQQEPCTSNFNQNYVPNITNINHSTSRSKNSKKKSNPKQQQQQSNIVDIVNTQLPMPNVSFTGQNLPQKNSHPINTPKRNSKGQFISTTRNNETGLISTLQTKKSSNSSLLTPLATTSNTASQQENKNAQNFRTNTNNSKLVNKNIQMASVFIPDNKNQNKEKKKATVYTKKKIPIISQPSAEEIARQKAQELEIRQQRLTSHFENMRNKIETQDYNASFVNIKDCLQRLLPFGLYNEPEFANDFLAQYDAELKNHSEMIFDRLGLAQQRFQSILYREAMCKMNEEKTLLLYLDTEFEKRQLIDEIAAKDTHTYSERIIDNLTSIPNLEHPGLDWEYHDWDSKRYQNIGPFSPELLNYENSYDEMDNDDQTSSDECMETDEIKFTPLKEEISLLNVTISCSEKQIRTEFANVQVHLQPYVIDNYVQDTNGIKADDVCSKISINIAESKDCTIKNEFEFETVRKQIDVYTTISIVACEHIKMNVQEQHKPVKLKLKLLKKDEFNNGSKTNSLINDENGQEWRGYEPDLGMSKKEIKKMKKLIKAQKKAKRREAVVEHPFNDKNERDNEEILLKPCSSNAPIVDSIEMIKEKSPLKISIRRIPFEKMQQIEDSCANANLEAKQNNIGPEKSQQNGTASVGILKLRIPKQIFGQQPVHSVTKETQQNGSTEEEKQEKHEGKKRKKRKRKDDETATECDQQKQPKKIPRIKIKLSSNESEQKSDEIDGNDLTKKQSSEMESKQTQEQTAREKRIQFSPCCSDDEDELRTRTSQLLSKFGI